MAGAAITLSAALLCGCVPGGSVESLLSPPKISEEQEEIYNALTEAVGSNITLQYPKGGASRSPVVISDIDRDGSNEALAFYEHADNDAGSGIRVNILDNSGGKWRSVYDIAGTGTSVDRVILSEMGGSGRVSIIIGYSAASGDKTFRTYFYSDGIAEAGYSDSYSSLFVTDLDNDGYGDLAVIHPNNEYTGKQAYFSLVTDNGKELCEISTVRLNDKTSEFVNIASGYVGAATPAVFIDGVSDSTLSTEIIYCINGTLRNPLYLGESEMIKNTVRPAAYLSTDIDLDGIIEVPTLSYFPGYNDDSHDKFRITNWNVMENYEITRKYSSYYNVQNGYCLLLPSRWEGVVTVKNDTVTGDIVFYKYRGNLLGSTEELLRIAVVRDERLPDRLAAGYTLLRSRDNINYLYKLPSLTKEPLILTATEIENNFCLM